MVSREDPGPGSGGFDRIGDGAVPGWTAGAVALVGPRFALVRVDFLDGARTGFFAACLVAARAFPDGRLEELTPELPDPAHRVRDGLERQHRTGPGRGLDDGGVLGFGHPFGMDPDHAQVDTTLQH